jgi:hypothetical protein
MIERSWIEKSPKTTNPDDWLRFSGKKAARLTTVSPTIHNVLLLDECSIGQTSDWSIK